MISLKDLAHQNGVSYEAVRQQVKRYAVELTGHIFVEGRTQFLDDFAVEFLEGKRKSNPVIVYESDKDEEIERLQEENKALLLRLSEKQEKIEQLQDRLIEAAGAPALLEAAKAQITEGEQRRNQLQVERDSLDQELQQAKDQLIEYEKQLQELREQREAESVMADKKRSNWLMRLLRRE